MQDRRPRSPVTRRSPSRHTSLLAAVAATIIVADQLTKTWALRALDDGPVDLFWTLRFNLAFNTGTAFSIAAGRGAIVALLAIGVVIAMVWMGRAISSRIGGVALGLVLGGAIGNLVDRAFRAGDGFLGGAVVDFVDLQWWPVFNLADSAIVIGALALILASAVEPDEPEEEPTVASPTSGIAVPHVDQQPTRDDRRARDTHDSATVAIDSAGERTRSDGAGSAIDPRVRRSGET